MHILNKWEQKRSHPHREQTHCLHCYKYDELECCTNRLENFLSTEKKTDEGLVMVERRIKQNKTKKNRVHHTYIYDEEREWISSHNKLLSWYRSYTVNDERLFHWRTEHNYNANEARSSFVLELLFILLVWFIHHGYHSFCHEDKG